MISENPAPDNDTMLTLIETNEQLNKSMNQHQRAVLSARQVMGLGNGQATPPPRTDSGFAAPPGPPPNRVEPARRNAPQVPPPGDFAPTGLGDDAEDPFADPREGRMAPQNPPFPKDQPSNLTGQFNDQLGVEPYHPGFKETPSYMGRQGSSVGHATMHAAVSERNDSPERRDTEVSDGYGIQPKTKAPVYKY
jgi:hypothetical protein